MGKKWWSMIGVAVAVLSLRMADGKWTPGACLELGPPGKGRCGSNSHCCGRGGAVCLEEIPLIDVGFEVDLGGGNDPPPDPPRRTYCCGQLGTACRSDDQCCENEITLPFARTSRQGSCGFYQNGEGKLNELKCCARFGTACTKNEDCCPEDPPRVCRQTNGRGPFYCGS